MRSETNISRSLRATHVVLAVVSFVLSFVPFSGTGASPQVKGSRPVQTEWVARQRVVTYRVAHYGSVALITSDGLSPYQRFGVQHYTRLAALTLATCARSHAPPVAHLFPRIISSSDHEDPLLNHSFLA